MITFGYSNRYSGILRALAAIALAVLIFFTPETAMGLLVKVFAGVLALVGIVALVFAIIGRHKGSFPLLLSNAVMDLLIAVLMFKFADYVASILIYVVGVVLCIMGIWEFIVLLSARRAVKFSFWPFAVPALFVAVFGAFLIIIPTSPVLKTSIDIFVGVALLLYGLSELMSSIKMIQLIRKVEKENTPDEQRAEVADAPGNDTER